MTERLSSEWPCNDCKRTAFCGACERPGIWMEKSRKKLAEYETAEEEGRLVVLPCNIGDVVYQLMVTDLLSGKLVYKIFEAKVCRIIIDSYSTCFSLETADDNKYTSELTNDDFGETVFLTREEAEKALEEMKKDE